MIGSGRDRRRSIATRAPSCAMNRRQSIPRTSAQSSKPEELPTERLLQRLQAIENTSRQAANQLATGFEIVLIRERAGPRSRADTGASRARPFGAVLNDLLRSHQCGSRLKGRAGAGPPRAAHRSASCAPSASKCQKVQPLQAVLPCTCAPRRWIEPWLPGQRQRAVGLHLGADAAALVGQRACRAPGCRAR